MKVTGKNSTYVGMWDWEQESCISENLFLWKVVENDGEGGGRIKLEEGGKGLKWLLQWKRGIVSMNK